MPITEPLALKLKCTHASKALKTGIDNLKSVIAITPPQHSAIQAALSATQQLYTRFEALQSHYIDALPDTVSSADQDQYTALISAHDDVIASWHQTQISANTTLASQPASTAAQQPRAPAPSNTKKPDRPIMQLGVGDEQWLFFTKEWEFYKSRANLNLPTTPTSEIASELWWCCSDDLRRRVFEFSQSSLDLATISESSLLEMVKASAVQGKNSAVHQDEFFSMFQQNDQRFHDYVSSLKSKAELCKFRATCTCGVDVSYALDMVSAQMIRGLADSDIQGHVLAKAGTLTTYQLKYDEVIAREAGQKARTDLAHNHRPDTSTTSSAAATSTYKFQQRSREENSSKN